MGVWYKGRRGGEKRKRREKRIKTELKGGKEGNDDEVKKERREEV